MATKKKKVTAADAMVVADQKLAEKFIDNAERAMVAIGALADGLQNIEDEQQGPALTLLRGLGKLLEDHEDVLKARIIAYLKEHGAQKTEKGTLEAHIGGYILEAQPTRTGYDSKKVEALLMVKAIAPVMGMDAHVTYKCNDGKLNDLITKKKLTNDELETCRYGESYRLVTPKKEG